jgi:hypothetical protein
VKEVATIERLEGDLLVAYGPARLIGYTFLMIGCLHGTPNLASIMQNIRLNHTKTWLHLSLRLDSM